MPDLRVTVMALEWPSFGRAAGGEGRYARRLCVELAALLDLTVITGPEPVPAEGVELVPVELTHTDRVDRYYRAPFRAARAVRAARPDVVHAHQDDWPLAFDPTWTVPIVRTYHGRKMAEANTSRPLRRLNHYALAGLEVACRRRYAGAVGVGPDSVAAFHCDRLIPPVFLTGEVPQWPEKAPEPLAVYIGAFHSRKRGHLALRAAAEARRRIPELRFAVVGPAADLPRYPPWVEFHVTPGDDEVRDLVGEAWVLLAPSSYEGFGIPAWEAMLSGTAVVATANPGIAFLSADGSCCAVVESEQLGETLTRLLESRSERADHSRRGFARACEVAKLGRPQRYVSLFNAVATT